MVHVSKTGVAVAIDLALVIQPFASIVRNMVADGLTAAFQSIEIAETKDATSSPDETLVSGAAPVPFIDKSILNWRDTYPGLVAHMLVPGHPTLFMVGLYVNDGSFNVPAFFQTDVIAKYLRAREGQARTADRIDRLRDSGITPQLNGGVRYMRNERHRVAVRHAEHIAYLRRLSRSLD